ARLTADEIGAVLAPVHEAAAKRALPIQPERRTVSARVAASFHEGAHALAAFRMGQTVTSCAIDEHAPAERARLSRLRRPAVGTLCAGLPSWPWPAGSRSRS